MPQAKSRQHTGRVGLDLRARPGQAQDGGGFSSAGVKAQRMRGWLPLPWRRTRPPRGGLPPELAASPLTAPAPRRRRLHPALLALICIQALLAGAAAWVLTSSTWQVRYVRVQGTNDAVVVQAIQALPLIGCDVFRCD